MADYFINLRFIPKSRIKTEEKNNSFKSKCSVPKMSRG